ncbi:hypothetical protein [Maribacter sp. 2308TA10-17]|uniref:hypothetical protein n=1 Tax=Maribacter sp. 2308TA10-17 TaxID=3386276 RepID=UPI0039BC7E0B
MRTITIYFLLLFVSFLSQDLSAQEEQFERKIEVLQNLKDKIVTQEKEALKEEVEKINEQLKNEDITAEQAKVLKEEAAKKHALNIENKIAIVDNKIALLKRNEDDVIAIEKTEYSDDDGMFKIDVNGERVVSINSKDWKREIKYDRRTYLDPVIAVGFNNTIIDGQSLEDSPYKLGGSRFLEFGWAWRTRVFKNSNALRLSYGVSFQFNGLKPKNNQYFVVDNGETELQEFEFDLRKSKFRMDNLVFPIHFEFGPSKFSKTDKRIRYSIRNQFRLGIGGYGGFNIGSRQKLKYKNEEGRNVKDKLKGGYDTSSFVYGLSAYVGFDGIQLYAKYDLNPIFRNAAVEQRNISLGVRFDLD